MFIPHFSIHRGPAPENIKSLQIVKGILLKSFEARDSRLLRSTKLTLTPSPRDQPPSGAGRPSWWIRERTTVIWFTVLLTNIIRKTLGRKLTFLFAIILLKKVKWKWTYKDFLCPARLWPCPWEWRTGWKRQSFEDKHKVALVENWRRQTSTKSLNYHNGEIHNISNFRITVGKVVFGLFSRGITFHPWMHLIVNYANKLENPDDDSETLKKQFTNL